MGLVTWLSIITRFLSWFYYANYAAWPIASLAGFSSFRCSGGIANVLKRRALPSWWSLMCFKKGSTQLWGSSSATIPIAITSNCYSYSVGSISYATYWAYSRLMRVPSSFLTISDFTPFVSCLMIALLVPSGFLVDKIMPLLLSTYLQARWCFILSYLTARCSMHFFWSKLYSLVKVRLVGWMNS